MIPFSALDFGALRDDVSTQLRSSLDPRLHYHGPHHTLVDVLPTATSLGIAAGLSDDDLMILRVAALFHDTGFLDQYEKNEPFGAQRALKTLRGDYGVISEAVLSRIEKAILATEMPQRPDEEDIISCLLCDADLGHLGRPDVFFLRSESLRIELNEVKGLNISPRKWHVGNISLFEKHHFWSESARSRFDEGKNLILQQTKELLGLEESV